MWPGRAAPQGQHAAMHLAPQPLLGVPRRPFLEWPGCWTETLGGVWEWDPPCPGVTRTWTPPLRCAPQRGVPCRSHCLHIRKRTLCLVNYFKISLPAKKVLPDDFLLKTVMLQTK